MVPVKKEITTKVVTEVKKAAPIKKVIVNTELPIDKNILYAQPITNGFQLINTKPAVVFQVLKTKLKDVYIIKNKNGILYKNENNWVAEYYKNNALIVESYQIKF